MPQAARPLRAPSSCDGPALWTEDGDRVTFEEVTAAGKTASCQLPRGCCCALTPPIAPCACCNAQPRRASQRRPCASPGRSRSRDGVTILAAVPGRARDPAAWHRLMGTARDVGERSLDELTTAPQRTEPALVAHRGIAEVALLPLRDAGSDRRNPDQGRTAAASTRPDGAMRIEHLVSQRGRPNEPRTLRLTQCPECGHLRVRERNCRVCEPSDPLLAELRRAQRAASHRMGCAGRLRHLLRRLRATRSTL